MMLSGDPVIGGSFDWGYGPPWFHRTLLDIRGEWYRLPRRPFPEPVWVPLGRDGRDVQVNRVEPERIFTALGPLAERYDGDLHLLLHVRHTRGR